MTEDGMGSNCRPRMFKLAILALSIALIAWPAHAQTSRASSIDLYTGVVADARKCNLSPSVQTSENRQACEAAEALACGFPGAGLTPQQFAESPQQVVSEFCKLLAALGGP